MRRRMSNPYYRPLKQVRRIQHSVKEDFSVLVVKIFVPVEIFPDFNFMGKMLGPKGKILKQLEASTNCKILIRGKGSSRNKIREISRFHSEEPLHVLITTEGSHDTVINTMDEALCKIRPYLEPDVDEKGYVAAVRSYEKGLRLKSTTEANETKLSKQTAATATTRVSAPAKIDHIRLKTQHNVPNENKKINPSRTHLKSNRPHFNPYVPVNSSVQSDKNQKAIGKKEERDSNAPQIMSGNQQSSKVNPTTTTNYNLNSNEFNQFRYRDYSSRHNYINEVHQPNHYIHHTTHDDGGGDDDGYVAAQQPHYAPMPTNHYNGSQEYSNLQYNHNIATMNQYPSNYPPQHGHVNPQSFYYDYNNAPPRHPVSDHYNLAHPRYQSSNTMPFQQNNMNINNVDIGGYHQPHIEQSVQNQPTSYNYYPNNNNNNQPPMCVDAPPRHYTQRFHTSSNTAQYQYRS